MNKVIFTLVLLCFLSISISIESYANIIVEASDSNAVVSTLDLFASPILTGSGKSGDYQVIACGIGRTGNEAFFDPSPGNWTELDQGLCGGGRCFGGIWGRFANTQDSEEIICSWEVEEITFAAGSFRYTGVDPDNPVIAVACDTGSELGTGVFEAVAPSVNTEAGSQVVRILTYGIVFDRSPTGHSHSNDDTSGSFMSKAAFRVRFNVSMQGQTEFAIANGPTGDAVIEIDAVSRGVGWRACTIALRMAPEARPIPTMSEWGLVAMAGILGIIGLFAIRRRAVA